MNTSNPYNCTKPGNLFVGYDEMLEELCSGFCNGHSYAIIAGRRSGKTSLLQRINEELLNKELPPFKPLGCYMDIQGIGKVTPALLFETIFVLIAGKLEVDQYFSGDVGREYDAFLRQMDKIQPILNKEYGPDWLVVLLVDELDTAIETLPDDQFFQNLRNLLMISRFHRHFRLVATGVRDMANLISSGSSPLNNLRSKYLRVLTSNQARELISRGSTKSLDPEIESFLFQLTGRHPYLLQGLLEKVFLVRAPITKPVLIKAANDFLKEHKDFSRWSAAFGPTEHLVYKFLTESAGKLAITKIRDKIDFDLVYGCDEAVTVLSYHGVVDDSDPDELEIAGTLFRDWYLKNISPKSISIDDGKNYSLDNVRAKNAKHLKLFLASPGDLQDERKEIERFIGKENRRLHPQNVFLELVIWEDLKQSFSGKRIQDYFNEELLKCHIVICLFFKEVGTFTKEEFDVAYRHFKEGKKPRYLYVFFKSASVEIDEIEESIFEIKNLKTEIKETEQIYKNFKSKEDLILQIKEQLDLIIPENIY